MAESTKALASLKKAANYSKLAMREFGPRSFKKGQGALLKVIYKFGEKNSIEKKQAEKTLGWCGKNLRHVAKKAQSNGYITIDEPDFAFRMTLTAKGLEVVQKRMKAEDKAVDTVFSGLTDKEIDQLIAITDKISKTCEDLGVDYSKIEKRSHKRGGHGKKGCEKHECHQGKDCHKGHAKYVFVFNDGSEPKHH